MLINRKFFNIKIQKDNLLFNSPQIRESIFPFSYLGTISLIPFGFISVFG